MDACGAPNWGPLHRFNVNWSGKWKSRGRTILARKENWTQAFVNPWCGILDVDSLQLCVAFDQRELLYTTVLLHSLIVKALKYYPAWRLLFLVYLTPNWVSVTWNYSTQDQLRWIGNKHKGGYVFMYWWEVYPYMRIPYLPFDKLNFCFVMCMCHKPKGGWEDRICELCCDILVSWAPNAIVDVIR